MVKAECRSTYVTRWALVTCLALILASPEWSAAQSRYSGIVVFGTSLSDPGNAFVLVGDANTPPDFTLNPLLIPSAPYAKRAAITSATARRGSSSMRGPLVWAIASRRPWRRLTLPSPITRSAPPEPTTTVFTSTWQPQTDTFLARSGGVASAQALDVIEMGGNDVRDAFQTYATGGDGGPIPGQALASIAANIHKLYVAGAREFLVWTAPHVGLTPAIRSLGPNAQGFAAFVAQAFNGGLAGVLAQLEVGLPGVSFVRLDAYQILEAIVADSADFGRTNVTTACVTPNITPFSCQDADTFLFWDGIHPTKAGHAILAQATDGAAPVAIERSTRAFSKAALVPGDQTT